MKDHSPDKEQMERELEYLIDLYDRCSQEDKKIVKDLLLILLDSNKEDSLKEDQRWLLWKKSAIETIAQSLTFG